MTEAINESHFEQPHWKVIARGLKTETWFEDGRGDGTGGILMPRPVKLREGNFYYRFASSASSREAQRGGGWWLDFENFKKVERFSRDNGYSLREAARLMLALPYDWTRVDLLVKAMLAEPVKAFAGEGKPALGASTGYDNATRWIPTQHIKVCQLYIPGLYVRGERPREQLFEKVFRQVTVKSLL